MHPCVEPPRNKVRAIGEIKECRKEDNTPVVRVLFRRTVHRVTNLWRPLSDRRNPFRWCLLRYITTHRKFVLIVDRSIPLKNFFDSLYDYLGVQLRCVSDSRSEFEAAEAESIRRLRDAVNPMTEPPRKPLRPKPPTPIDAISPSTTLSIPAEAGFLNLNTRQDVMGMVSDPRAFDQALHAWKYPGFGRTINLSPTQADTYAFSCLAFEQYYQRFQHICKMTRRLRVRDA